MKFISEKFNLKHIINEHYILLCIAVSLLLNIIIECLARLSLPLGFLYIAKHPFYFLYNVFLILLTFSLALLCKKRIFSTLLVTVLWLAAGITNAVLIHFRHTPFIAADFFVIQSALDVMDIYMTKFQICLLIGVIILAFGSLIALLIKEKSKKNDYRKICLLLSVALITALLPTDHISAEKESRINPNITDEAYTYGFACCFLNSVFNSGAIKPDEYSKRAVKSILKKTDNDSKPPKNLPNIVTIQLESFIDPYKIPNTTYTSDPIPNFRELKENYSSGKLGVSVYGGGTANTEFEVLSGMSTRYFGIGEYPYETILQKQAVETVCYNLKELGYKSHAMHNHTGTFYDRYIVYKNLGFDTFTPYEYMNNIEYNLLGWEKSSVFTEYIIKALDKTDERDFIFAVTSQCHGKYPTERDRSLPIKVDGSELIMSMQADLEYYVNELHDEDYWLGEMIEAMENYPEPIIAVIYGDHMPSLASPDELMSEEEIYSTEYVIWTNYQTRTENKDLETYSLMSKALDMADIHNGVMTKVNQYGLNSKDDNLYNLKTIQYDLLYGERYVYNESESLPYTATDMTLGIDDIEIYDVSSGRSKTKITGINFTPSSVVYVDGHAVDTEFIDENTLQIQTKACKGFSVLTVAQRAVNLTVLGETKPYYSN